MNRQLHYLCAAFLGAGMLHITPPYVRKLK